MEGGLGKRRDEEARVGTADEEDEEESEQMPLRESSRDRG